MFTDDVMIAQYVSERLCSSIEVIAIASLPDASDVVSPNLFPVLSARA